MSLWEQLKFSVSIISMSDSDSFTDDFSLGESEFVSINLI